jgi:simple sugar transport system substrate-binding protein
MWKNQLVLVGSLAAILLAMPRVTSAPAAEPEQIRIAFIAHTSFSHSGGFWATIKNGAEQAAKDLTGHNVHVEFLAPEQEDPSVMAGVIGAAVATNPSAIAVSLPAVDAERGPIQAAVSKGIPVVTYNSGVDDFRSVGSLAHVGSVESEAGLAAGDRLTSLGARNVLCSNAVPTNIATVTRCKAISEALAKAGGKAEQFVGNMNDPAAEKEIISAKLLADPTIDAVIGIGEPDTVEACLQLQQDQQKKGKKLHCATFDTFKEAMDGIQAGTVDFAVAQQPFLQGYYPVLMLTQYILYHVMPGGRSGVIATGPFLIDKNNIAAVNASAANGTF